MQSFYKRILKNKLSFKKEVLRCFYSINKNHTCDNKAEKTFESIPGPRRLPLFGNLHLFTRFGPYSFDKLYDAYADLHKKYGPVVRLDLGANILALFNPDDIQKILDLSDQYPERPAIEALKYYRLKHKELYGSAGLTNEKGQEWKRLREAVNFIMDPKFVEQYLSAQEEIAQDFAERISIIRDQRGEVKDFLPELYRFTEEAIGLVCFGVRLGLIYESKSDTSWSTKITQASEDTLQAFADTLLGFPWWKLIKTRTYKKLVESQEFFHKFALECMEKAESKLKDSSTADDITLQFYKKLSKNSGVNSTDIGLLMTELFSAGIDATGNQIAYTIYHLAKHPSIQEKLYEEIKTHVPEGEKLTKSAMNKMTYLRACIKESYRLTPTPGGSARILKSPTVISGYLVPANVLCIGINPVIGRLPENFPDPLHYKPERWLDKDAKNPAIKPHPFCILPFGHGVRRCVGQRFAEQEIRVCLIKLLQKYRVKYEGPDMEIKMRLLLIPDKPLNFVFESRNGSHINYSPLQSDFSECKSQDELSFVKEYLKMYPGFAFVSKFVQEYM